MEDTGKSKKKKRHRRWMSGYLVIEKLPSLVPLVLHFYSSMSYQTGGQDSYYPGVGNQDYNGENQEDESAYYDGSSMNGGGVGAGAGGSSKLSHFRERNSFLQQQQQQQQQREQPQMSGNSKINFPSKHSRLY